MLAGWLEDLLQTTEVSDIVPCSVFSIFCMIFYAGIPPIYISGQHCLQHTGLGGEISRPLQPASMDPDSMRAVLENSLQLWALGAGKEGATCTGKRPQDASTSEYLAKESSLGFGPRFMCTLERLLWHWCRKGTNPWRSSARSSSFLSLDFVLNAICKYT